MAFRSLNPWEARHSLAERVQRYVDRANQIVTNAGLAPYRVWLVWTRFDGASSEDGAGAGNERVMARVEILPTPRVTDLTAITYRSTYAGMYPDGSIRVDQITTLFTEDELRGLKMPARGVDGRPAPPSAGCTGKGFDEQYGPNVDFAFWVQEDGRGDNPARINRYRLLSQPFRDVNSNQWVVLLQRSDRDPRRDGAPVNIGVGPEEFRRLMSR